jgi:hypothetical protein
LQEAIAALSDCKLRIKQCKLQIGGRGGSSALPITLHCAMLNGQFAIFRVLQRIPSKTDPGATAEAEIDSGLQQIAPPYAWIGEQTMFVGQFLYPACLTVLP